MPITILKELLAATDLNWDTPGHGNAPNTMNKTASNGSTTTPERPSAFHIGVLDVPPVSGTGARGSFTDISPTTDRTIENCIQELAKKGLAAYSFKGWGGEAGVGIGLDNAKRNTAVWKAIADRAGSQGAVIFMPELGYEFAFDSTLGGLFATHILPWKSAGGLILIGGGNTIIRANSGSTGHSGAFLHIAAPTSNVVLSDFTLDVNGRGGVELDMTSLVNGEQYNDVHVIRVTTTGTSPTFVQVGNNVSQRLTVVDCNFNGVGTFQVTGWLKAIIQNCAIPGRLSIQEHVSATGGSHRILNNQLFGTGDIQVVRGKDIIVGGNSLTRGILDVNAATESQFVGNNLFRGSIKYINSATAVSKISFTDNFINALTSDELTGFRVVSTAALNDLTVSRNHITGAEQHGIEILMGSAPLTRGYITDNTLINNSQDTPSPSIELNSLDASSGTVDYFVTRNICRSTDNSAPPHKQSVGILQEAFSSPDAYANTWVYENYIKGYTTLITAPDCVAPPWAASVAVAQLDGGATV